MLLSESAQATELRLQRGRAPESAEIAAFFDHFTANGWASTGPRSGERGDCFATLAKLQTGRASTGPRSGERGDLRGLSEIGTRLKLQRGRAPESAEMRASPT